MLELPHSSGCLVCGRANAHGLHLHLLVDEQNGDVHVEFTPSPVHMGFEGITHGGVLATVLDEAMVWAATWAGRRFVVAGEMTVRYRANAPVGGRLHVTAAVENSRVRMLQTTARIVDAAGGVIATASGKYVPIPAERHRQFVAMLLEEPATAKALAFLRQE